MVALPIPQIDTIEGYSVENIKTSEETIIINTRRANKVTKTYRMFAKKSITIPSFTIEVDDKYENSCHQPLRYRALKLRRLTGESHILAQIPVKPVAGETLFFTDP